MAQKQIPVLTKDTARIIPEEVFAQAGVTEKPRNAAENANTQNAATDDTNGNAAVAKSDRASRPLPNPEGDKGKEKGKSGIAKNDSEQSFFMTVISAIIAYASKFGGSDKTAEANLVSTETPKAVASGGKINHASMEQTAVKVGLNLPQDLLNEATVLGHKVLAVGRTTDFQPSNPFQQQANAQAAGGGRGA